MRVRSDRDRRTCTASAARLFVVAFAVLGAASAHGEPGQVVVECEPGNGTCGDGLSRGFYLEDYPAGTLDTVTLYYCANVAGTYTVTLTAREDTYDGSLVDSVARKVVITESGLAEPIVFDFGGAAATPGGVLAFSQTGEGPGGLLYDVSTSGDLCLGVVETEGTSPPLDTVRRSGVGIVVTAPEPSDGLLRLATIATLGTLSIRQRKAAR